MEIDCSWQPTVSDGTVVSRGATVARITGSARDLLTSERILLNLLSRLSGVATLTTRYVQAVAKWQTGIYDTRKTTPGWRRLEKYAVRCGGGCNHRTGLFDAILIKDNHLAVAAQEDVPLSLEAAVIRAREFLAEAMPDKPTTIVEIEVDTIEQFLDVLPAKPDAVLLDNMTEQQLCSAVEHRNQIAPTVVLEASGGINLETVARVAATGIDRISVGALTHSAVSLDIGLDWN